MPRSKERSLLTFGFPGIEGQHKGFSKDMGPTGIHVGTNFVKVKVGQLLWVKLEVEGKPFEIDGEVAWIKKVPREIQGVERGSIGVRILRASEDWFSLFM